MDEADRQAVHGVRDWYNEIAVEFERRYEGAGGDFWRVFEESLAFELLGNPGRRILDLGCGPGRLSKSLSQRAPFVLATDIAIAMVALAQRTKPAPNVHYCVMDATRLALKPGTIDEVISLGMFEYLEDPAPFLDEIHRAMRDGGQLLFTVHNRPGILFRTVRAIAKWARLRRGTRRDTFYRPCEHAPSVMTAHLQRHGLKFILWRGFHARAAAFLFKTALRIRAASLALRVRGFAVALDRALGRWRLTKGRSPITMYRASKSS